MTSKEALDTLNARSKFLLEKIDTLLKELDMVTTERQKALEVYRKEIRKQL